MHGQAQRLLLERHQGGRALLAARNFPIRGSRAGRHGRGGDGGGGGACVGEGGRGAPEEAPGERLVRLDCVRTSLAHVPQRVAPGRPAALRAEAHLGVQVLPVPAGLAAVLLRSCALKETHWTVRWMDEDIYMLTDNCNHTHNVFCPNPPHSLAAILTFMKNLQKETQDDFFLAVTLTRPRGVKVTHSPSALPWQETFLLFQSQMT